MLEKCPYLCTSVELSHVVSLGVDCLMRRSRFALIDALLITLPPASCSHAAVKSSLLVQLQQQLSTVN